jgi:3-hydroxybutyryl-CoA dehydrogenase
MRCVEVIRAPLTSERTAATAIEFVRRLEKEPVVMKKEINGFIANRIVNAIRDEAIFLYEGGYASIPDIDLASRTALGHPMGPFELQDLTGLDVGYAIKAGRFEESGDPADAPSSALASRVQAGHLGRKAGRGWYLYAPDGTRLGAAPSP